MTPEELLLQQIKDRAELEISLRNGINKPLAWCNIHDCKLHTCFSLHYPESIASEA